MVQESTRNPSQYRGALIPRARVQSPQSKLDLWRNPMNKKRIAMAGMLILLLLASTLAVAAQGGNPIGTSDAGGPHLQWRR
jgi:hypothetical protein